MKIIVLNGINYYLEAVTILITYHQKNSNYESLKERLMQKFNIPVEKSENMLRDIVNIYNYVVNRLDIPKDKIELFFHSENPDVPSLCELIMFPLIYNYDGTSKDKYFSQWEEQKLENAIKTMFYAFEYDIDIENFTHVDYINHINNLDIDNETKYKYVLLCCNIDKAFNEVIGYINETVVLLKEKEKELQ